MKSAAWRLRALGAATIAAGALCALLVTYGVHSALPPNPIELPFAKKLQVRAWLPEGWAFFTASPQSPSLVPYARAAGRWAPASVGPNGRASNAFGLRRLPRLQHLELEALGEQLAKTDWKPCEGPDEACLEAPTEPVVVHNTSKRPTLCGDVAFFSRKPVPWAWARLPQTFTMPSTVARLVVSC